MKKSYSVFLLFCFLFVLRNGIAVTYPTYRETLKEFFKNYQLPDAGKGYRFDFAKKPEGVYIYLFNEDPESPSGSHYKLFWSADKEKYLKLDFKKADKKIDKEQVETAIEDYKETTLARFGYYFNLLPYYGYIGWYDDILDKYGQSDNLNAEEYNGLALAHISKANELIFPFNNYQSIVHPFDKSFDIKDVPQTSIDEAIKHYKKGIAAYKNIMRIAPEYKTTDGNIALQYWNEHVATYLALEIMGLKEDANKFINRDLYNDFYINYGKNLLKNCKQNSILFVSGDIDTYVTLFIQKKLQFRTDVTIINDGLTYKPRYINYLCKEKNIQLSLHNAVYKSKISSSIKLKPVNRTTISLHAFFQRFVDSSNVHFDTLKAHGETVLELPFSSFSTTVYNDAGKKKSMNWRLSSYDNDVTISRDYLFFFDLLYTDSLKSPIQFVFYSDKVDHFYANEEQVGLVINLAPLDNDDYRYMWKVNTDAIIDYLKKEFVVGSFEGLTPAMAEDDYVIEQYRFLFYYLTNELFFEDEHKKAELLLDSCFQLLPNNTIPYDFSVAYLAMIYYEVDAIKKGDLAMGKFANRIKKYIQENPAPTTRQQKMKYRNYLYDLLAIYSIAKSFDRIEIMKLVAEETLKLKKSLEETP